MDGLEVSLGYIRKNFKCIINTVNMHYDDMHLYTEVLEEAKKFGKFTPINFDEDSDHIIQENSKYYSIYDCGIKEIYLKNDLEVKITTNGREIILNSIQVKALELMKDFLNNKQKENYFFDLSGSAGTGKTTIMKEALKDEYSVIVTAPTHKAKKVIARVTGYQSETIQKILGLRPDMKLEDFTQNNVVFSLIGKCLVEDYRTLIIDECSMLTTFIVNHIKKICKQYNVKVIFMGDRNQLPPIDKEKKEGFQISSVFTDEEILHFQLTKVERQKVGNPLIELYDKILSDIDSKKDMYNKESDIVNGIGYQFISDKGIFTELLLEKFKENKIENKILCFQNIQATRWNNYIRKELLGKVGKFYSGDIIMSHRTVSDQVNWRVVVSENSAEYELVSFEYGHSKNQRFVVNREDHFKIIKCVKCVLRNLDSLREEILFFVDPESYDEFSYIEHIIGNWAKKVKAGSERGFAWKTYYEFRNKYFLLGDIIDSSGSVLVAKDFDYAYALTTYKCQGSTYENVFVDKADLDSVWDASSRNRHQYVAYSRPTKASYIYYKN